MIFGVSLAAAACGPAPRTEQPEPEPIEQPRAPIEPIRGQSHAEELYKADRMAEAAWVFEQMVAGNMSADISLERAEFWLAKSYYQTHDHSRSLAVFRNIAGNPQHEYHTLALPWLATLTRQFPDQALEAMLWYPIETIDDEAFDEIRDELHYMYGRWYIRHGNAKLGERLLRSVPVESDYYSTARFELAEAMWRSGRQQDALPYYREVVQRWTTERERASRKQRKQPPPEHVELSIQRLRSRGVVVGPHGEL